MRRGWRRPWLSVPTVAALVAAVACGSNPKFAGLSMAPRRAELRERLVVRDLANGMRVILVPDARTNLVSVSVHYRVGGADDPAGEFGLAHYVEHVVYEAAFGGAGGAERHDAQLDANAMTSLDRTYFYATAFDTELERLLETAARRLELTCTDLDDATLARERDVVVEEMKDRARFRWSNEAVMAAMWGTDHPYAHGSGGTDFADIAREPLCAFIDHYYGPASAVMVVTGNVRDADMDRIRARFEPIATRAPAKRARPAPLAPTSERVTIAGLARPAVMLVFPVPEEGGDDDAAIAMLDGARWPIATAVRSVQTVVIGEVRARAVVAYAEASELDQLDGLEAAMRSEFTRPRMPGFAQLRDRARLAAVGDLDDILAAGFKLATAERRDQLTRFRALRQLDAVNEGQATRWLDASKARVVRLVPETGEPGVHRVAQLTTALHQVEVLRAPVAVAEPTIPTRPAPEVVDYRLSNGMRVLLSPDQDSIGFDARLVIAGGEQSGKLATVAAWLLSPTSGIKDGWEGLERVKWYQAIGTPVFPVVERTATTFRVTGLGLFGDWHVWNLAWTVLYGEYPDWLDGWSKKPASLTEAKDSNPEPPAAPTVLLGRVFGTSELTRTSWPSRAELEAYRRAAYRPERAALIVAGAFEVRAMKKEIDRLFGGWRADGDGAATTATSSAVSNLPSFVLVPDENAPTVGIAAGYVPGGSQTDPDRLAAAVLDEMLGERLRSIRESLGVSYGIQAAVGPRAVLLVGDVEPAYATDAAAAMAAEVDRLRRGGAELTDDFVRAKRRVLARVLAQPLGPTKRAAELERIAIAGAAVDASDRDLDALRTLDLAAVTAVAARDLRSDRLIIVARGPAAAAKTALVAFGADAAKVETFTAE